MSGVFSPKSNTIFPLAFLVSCLGVTAIVAVIYVETKSDYAAQVGTALDQPVSFAWNRVQDPADHVYFNHASHVHKGVGCVALSLGIEVGNRSPDLSQIRLIVGNFLMRARFPRPTGQPF